MNKTQLVDALAVKTGLKKKDAAAAVDAVFESITEALAGGDKVQVTGFGTFAVKHREARIGRNPHTKKEIDIPASNHCSFSVSKTLKDEINK